VDPNVVEDPGSGAGEQTGRWCLFQTSGGMMKDNPPAAADAPMVEDGQIGIIPG
jgi:hypothetical protein